MDPVKMVSCNIFRSISVFFLWNKVRIYDEITSHYIQFGGSLQIDVLLDKFIVKSLNNKLQTIDGMVLYQLFNSH